MGGKEMNYKKQTLMRILEEDFIEQKRLAKLEKEKRQRYFEKKRRREEFRKLDKMIGDKIETITDLLIRLK